MKRETRMLFFENRILDFFSSKVIPILSAVLVNQNLKEEIDKISSKPDYTFYKVGMTKEILEKLMAKELDRKKTIEDKAKTTVASVTIAISLLTTLIGIINGTNTFKFLFSSTFSYILILVFILGFFYLVTSGLCALRALQLNFAFDMYLHDEIELINKGEVNYISRMIKNINLNYLVTPQREVYVNASYQSIKNGIYCLVLFVILCIGLMSSGNIVNSENFHLSGEVPIIKVSVVEVINAATIRVDYDGQPKIIKLASITPPIKGEPFGLTAYEYVKELVLNKEVGMVIINKTSESIYAQIIMEDGRSLQSVLLANGFAKLNTTVQQLANETEYIKIQNEAKNDKRGIWD